MERVTKFLITKRWVFPLSLTLPGWRWLYPSLLFSMASLLSNYNFSPITPHVSFGWYPTASHVHTAILSLFLCMICLYWERCVKNDTPLNRTPVQSDEWKMAFYAALSHLMRIGESNGNAWINDDDNDVDGLFPTSTWRLKTFREPRSQYDSLSYRTVTEPLNTQMTAWKGFVSMAFVRLIFALRFFSCV